MRALVLTAYRELSLTDVPDPQVGPHDVLVAVKACGVCGSDIHGFDGSTGRRQPPIIMGHEASGQIAVVGTGVSDWHVGERVTFDSTVYCGVCETCAAGRPNLCPKREVIGVSCDEYRREGAFAEYLSVPSHLLHRLPENLSYEQAAMAEPVAVALHAVNRAHCRPGCSAVVFGAGLIGLLIVQALKLRGAGTVIAVDQDSGRLSLARTLGADHTLEAREDIVTCIRGIAGADGADLAMEAVGIAATMQGAVRSVRKGATVCCVGNLVPEVALPIQLVVTRELDLFGCYGSAGEYGEAIAAIACRSIQVDPLLSAFGGLEEGPEWFQRLHHNRGGLLKVILRP